MPGRTDVLRKLPKDVHVEGVVRLPHTAFVPLDKQGRLPVVPLSEGTTGWDGQPRKLTIPNTINTAIAEAEVHMAMMDFAGISQDEAWKRPAPEPGHPDTRSRIRGYSSHPIDRRTALLHVFFPPEQERPNIKDADSAVIARRAAGVPPTVDVVTLYEHFVGELKPKIDRTTGVAVPTTFSITAEDAEANLQTRLKHRENPLSARFATVLDLLETEWSNRDAKINATAEAKSKLEEKNKNRRVLPEDLHELQLDLDRPTGADGQKIEGHIVYDALASTSVENGEGLGRKLMSRVETIFDARGQLKVGLEGDDAKLVEQIVSFRPDGIELVFNQTAADAAADPNRALQIANRVRITPKSDLGKRISQKVKKVRSR